MLKSFKINIKKHINIQLAEINNKRYLIISSDNIEAKYLFLGSDISLEKINIYPNNNEPNLKISEWIFFISNINKVYKIDLLQRKIYYFFLYFNRLYVKRLFIRGLGYRLNYVLANAEQKLYDKTMLEFKLGLSHSKFLNVKDIPSSIRFRFKIRKRSTVIHLQSVNKAFLGNYASKIAALKKINDYKEKGIIPRYLFLKLKQVKKK